MGVAVAMAACSRLAWKGSRSGPGPVVPSGNTATVSPARSASAMACTTRSASRLRSRSMNSVPAPATSQPSSGQRRTSALDTKRACGTAACSAAMSSHDTWLATSSVAPGRGVPRTCRPTPTARSRPADHHWMRAWRPAASSDGKRSAITAMPCSTCSTSRATRHSTSGTRARPATSPGIRRQMRRRPRCRPPAWPAPGRASRCRWHRRRTACACPG